MCEDWTRINFRAFPVLFFWKLFFDLTPSTDGVFYFPKTIMTVKLKADCKKKAKASGKNGVVPPAEHRFSKENQPSPKAKSEGLKKWHERNRLKDNIAEVFAEAVPDAAGKKHIAMRAFAVRLRNYFLAGGDCMSDEQATAAIKLIGLLAPAENKLDLTVRTEKISQDDLKQIMAERLHAAKPDAPGNTD